MTGASNPFGENPDRFLRLQEQMAGHFSQLAALAMQSGWKEEEVAAALVELADNHMLGVLANRDFARGLADLGK